MNEAKIAATLMDDEGVKASAYKDSLGYLTIGVGRLIDARKGGGLSSAEIVYLLTNDIKVKAAELDAHLPWWRKLDEPRQHVLLNMCFNLGIGNLTGFINTLKAIQEGRYADAATGMLASKWATQVGDRAKRLAETMKTGIEHA